MTDTLFKNLILAVAIIFTVFFCFTIIPALIANPDIIGAITAGFVNPYASGYSTDVILCGLVLAIWIIYEAKQHSIKSGWICIVLSLVPGVVVGFALYLVIRHSHFKTLASAEA